MTRLRVSHAIRIGVALAAMTAARLVAVTWQDGSGMLNLVVVVGGPLSLPWLALWGLERAPRDRALGVGEGTFYGLLAVCEVGLFFYLPGALVRSEGFMLFPVWGGSVLAAILLVLVNEFSKPPP